LLAQWVIKKNINMGRYADPQIIVDKRFEKVRGELDKLYKNVDNNLQLISKRKQARKQAQAKKYSGYGDIYNKATKDARSDSRRFARTRPDMAKDAKSQFSDQIADRFNEGYDNIKAFIAGQYISKEGEEPIKNPTESQINAFVQGQIDAANDLGESLVAFEGLANAHAKGIKAGGKDGKKAGSVVIGSEFSNIFNAMTGDEEGQSDIQWSRMKLSGSLTGGTTIYFDGQAEGEEGFGIADPDTEVIDLSVAKKNYMNGNQEAYFKTIKEKKEVLEDMRTPIKTLQNNKAVNLFDMYSTTDENGNPIKMKVLNQKKTQDYFITGKGAAITIDAMVEKHGGIDAAVQAYFGADVAAKFPEPGEKGYDQAMLKLKTRLYEDLDPLISDGDKHMLSPNKETTSRQFTKDTNSKVVKSFYEEVHGEVGKLLPTLPNDTEQLAEFNRYIQDRPYSQGGSTYTITRMEPAQPGSSNMVLVMKNGSRIQPEEGYFKLNDPQARRKLEQGLMKGNFQGTTDRRHVDGYYNSEEFGGEVEENYNGAEKESVRITSTKSKGGISYDEYMEKVEGAEKPLNSNTIDWPWETDGLGGGSQAAATDTDNSIQAQLGIQPQATTPQPQNDNMGVNYVGGLENPDLSVGGSTFKLSAPDGSALNFKSTDAKSKLLEEKDDGKNALRKIGNFEALAGSPGGKGLSNYGMGNEYQDQVKSAGLDPSTEEGFMYAVETVAKGNVINELNLPEPARFDDLDETLKASMIDWEYNTGRDVGDLMHIAQMMKDDSWKSEVDLGGITLTQLVNARGSKKVNVKIGDKTYKTAAEAMKGIKADDSPVSFFLDDITPEEVANAKHAIMSDKTSRTASDIATYNKTWKYRIDQLK